MAQYLDELYSLLYISTRGLQNRTEQNRNFIQLKLRPLAGGVRVHNTNK